MTIKELILTNSCSGFIENPFCIARLNSTNKAPIAATATAAPAGSILDILLTAEAIIPSAIEMPTTVAVILTTSIVLLESTTLDNVLNIIANDPAAVAIPTQAVANLSPGIVERIHIAPAKIPIAAAISTIILVFISL